MTPIQLQALLWLPLVTLGGVLSLFTMLFYARDLWRARHDEEATGFQREIAHHRVRAELTRVAGWGLFLLMGLSAIGWKFDPLLWVGAFFGTMFFWLYAAARAFQMRLRFGVTTGPKEENGGGGEG